MSKKNTGELENGMPAPLLHDDHKAPVTRRDFLGAGLLSFSGYMMAPSLVTVLSRSAQAAEGCAVEATTRLPAFINVHLEGGYAAASNYLALDAGGAPLTRYDLVGLGTNPGTVTEFGGVLFPARSAANQLLAGIRTAATANTIARTSFLGVCVQSQDDGTGNQNSKLDITGLVTAAGLTGELLPKLGNVGGTATGTSLQTYAYVKPPAPLIVRSINDLNSALSAPGTVQTLSATQRDSMLKLINGLSASQSRVINSVNSASGRTLSKLVQCATDKNIELSANTNPGVDPTRDTTVGVSGLWGMATNATQFGQSQNSRIVMGSMVYNALKGNAGSVGLDLGGFDYHGSARAQTDARDANAGQVIGRILESAAQMNQKVFIHVTTNGATGTQAGSDDQAAPNGDRGSGSLALVFMFDPAGRPQIKNDRAGAWQLGHFTPNGQSSDDKTIVGTPEKAGAAVFANYLKFAGQVQTLEKVLPRQYTAQELDQVLRLA